MIVLKFGGSSVANATNMSRVLDIVEAAAEDDRVILVSSAISGCTDRLIALSREEDRTSSIEQLRLSHKAIVERLFTGSCRREVLGTLDTLFDSLMKAPAGQCPTYGELFSTTILAAKLGSEGYRVKWLDSREIIKLRGGSLDKELTYSNIASSIDEDTRIFVAPGFIAGDENGKPTDLGRGGSDYSAAIYAAAAKALEMQIWTDVPGIMSANPKDVPEAHTLPFLSYEAAFELAAHGAKVLYPPTIQPAREAGIPIKILNSFDPGNPGTVIRASLGRVERWVGVTCEKEEAGVCGICLVGESISNFTGAAGRILRALSGAGISICVEIRPEGRCTIRVPVRSTVWKQALAAIHREFFEERAVTAVDIYIAGHGAVGSALVDLIAGSADRIAERQGRSVRIVGVADSRRFVIEPEGLLPAEVEARLGAAPAQKGGFVDEVLRTAHSKSVFVDCTDSFELHSRYAELFRRGLGVVTSNRRSLAIPYAQYVSLKRTARENGVFFRYDTTVGTALPVLESIAGSANCTDEILAIDAVVSCTMNQIISAHEAGSADTLADLLREAQRKGLTEADPRVDLGGGDALRKLLILAREAGVSLEENDVSITPALPPEYFGCPLEEFYGKLESGEKEFSRHRRELESKGLRERFVATMRRDGGNVTAEIRMQEVGPDSPFYWVSGTENIIRIESRNSAPLIIRGAGEGAREAASSILNNILK